MTEDKRSQGCQFSQWPVYVCMSVVPAVPPFVRGLLILGWPGHYFWPRCLNAVSLHFSASWLSQFCCQVGLWSKRNGRVEVSVFSRNALSGQSVISLAWPGSLLGMLQFVLEDSLLLVVVWESPMLT